MSRDKQIEEMASILCPQYNNGKCVVYGKCEDNCSFREDYKRLYNAGYRKQKEARWKGAGMGDYYCSICCSTYSGGDEFNFCPNCGAHMKGE